MREKLIWLLALLLLAAGSLACGEKAGEEGAAVVADAGRIEVSEATFDIGEINRGDTATHVFTIKNTGKGVLRINKAQGS